MVLHGINFPEDRLAEFCRANRVARLSLFGSILRDDFSPESDVDILIEFEPEVRMGLFKFMGLAMELEGIVGRKVDLRGAEDLSPLFRTLVVKEAMDLFQEPVHCSTACVSCTATVGSHLGPPV